MRALALFVAALIGTFLVVGVDHAAPAQARDTTGQHLYVGVPALAHTHPDLGLADEATPGAPVVALQRNHLREAVAVPVAPTAARVDTRVARGPPNGR
ncbi:hypothetical protein AB0I60_19890 [Actinosynnema sp. NPDC050436]|uniref:hypothetical protein n=1 Tax=Actinosynnema sp. NPDC050436 TaxID=3155659 RepID=UPI0033D1B712